MEKTTLLQQVIKHQQELKSNDKTRIERALAAINKTLSERISMTDNAIHESRGSCTDYFKRRKAALKELQSLIQNRPMTPSLYSNLQQKVIKIQNDKVHMYACILNPKKLKLRDIQAPKNVVNEYINKAFKSNFSKSAKIKQNA